MPGPGILPKKSERGSWMVQGAALGLRARGGGTDDRAARRGGAGGDCAGARGGFAGTGAAVGTRPGGGLRGRRRLPPVGRELAAARPAWAPLARGGSCPGPRRKRSGADRDSDSNRTGRRRPGGPAVGRTWGRGPPRGPNLGTVGGPGRVCADGSLARGRAIGGAGVDCGTCRPYSGPGLCNRNGLVRFIFPGHNGSYSRAGGAEVPT